MSKDNYRNSSVELYRVLLMFMIVLYHSTVHGYFKMSEHRGIFIAYVAFLVWHVDGFLSITGWFGTKFTVARFVKLSALILFYTVPTAIYGLMTGASGRALLAGGWFGHAYLLFLFATPLLNAAIEYLSDCSRRKHMMYVWAVLDVGVLLNWCPYSMMGSSVGTGVTGCSIVTFYVIYINVRFLRISGFLDCITKRLLLIALGIFPLCLIFWATISTIAKLGFCLQNWSWNFWLAQFTYMSMNNAPHVFLMAFATLVFFVKYVRVSERVGRVVNFLGPLMFGVYVIHDTTGFGSMLYRYPQMLMSEKSGLDTWLIVFLSAVITFCSCIAIECLRRALVGPIVNYAMPRLAAVDKWLMGLMF